MIYEVHKEVGIIFIQFPFCYFALSQSWRGTCAQTKRAAGLFILLPFILSHLQKLGPGREKSNAISRNIRGIKRLALIIICD